MRPTIKGKVANNPYNYAIGFNFYIDNVLLDKITSTYDKEFPDVQKQTWTTYRGTLKTSEIGKNLGQKPFKELLDNYTDLLSKGKHKIKIEIYPLFINPDNKEITRGNVIAAGEFSLNIKNTVFDTDDEDLCLGKNIMNDNVLIKNIAKTLSKGKNFTVLPNDIRIFSDSWTIERNKYSGIIERRRIEVVYGYKNATNGKCYKSNYTFSQNYIGNKFTDELTFKYEGSIGKEMGEINCNCIKK